METSLKQTGVAMALLEKFKTQRLDVLLAIQARVEQGERLSETDIVFLNEVFENSHTVKSLVDKNADYQPLYARIVNLYHDIIAKGLENEQKATNMPLL